MKKTLLSLALLAAAGVAHAQGLSVAPVAGGLTAGAGVGIDNVRLGPIQGVLDTLTANVGYQYGDYHLDGSVMTGSGQGLQTHGVTLVGAYDLHNVGLAGLTVSPMAGLSYQALSAGPQSGYVGRYATNRWFLGANASMPIASTGLTAHAMLAAGRSFAPTAGSSGNYEAVGLGVSAPMLGGAVSVGYAGSRNTLGGSSATWTQNSVDLGYQVNF